MSSGISGVMSALRAEELMKGSQLFDQITKLRTDLSYRSEEGKLAFDDYFKQLVGEVDAIPKLKLEDDVASGTETTYTIQLTQATENIVDECDRLFRRLNQFEGKLKDAERQVINQKSEFVAWYMLAAGMLLKDLESKLPQVEIRKLAEAEFSRLAGNLDMVLMSLLSAVDIETNRVSQHKATQKEKYNLGKDQANASWTSSLPALGNAFTEDRGDVSGVQELDDEDVPAKVAVKPQISIGDTLRIIQPAATVEIKGTFAKVGDPQPVTPVEHVLEAGKAVRQNAGGFLVNSEEKPKSSRKRLIEEEDEAI